MTESAQCILMLGVFIEKMQPYGRTGRAALKYLDALHNFDKHRTLHLVVAQTTDVAAFGDLLDFVDFVNFGPLKDGDPLLQVPPQGRT